MRRRYIPLVVALLTARRAWAQTSSCCPIVEIKEEGGGDYTYNRGAGFYRLRSSLHNGYPIYQHDGAAKVFIYAQILQDGTTRYVVGERHETQNNFLYTNDENRRLFLKNSVMEFTLNETTYNCPTDLMKYAGTNAADGSEFSGHQWELRPPGMTTWVTAPGITISCRVTEFDTSGDVQAAINNNLRNLTARANLCCPRIIVEGSVFADGIYRKGPDLENGRAAYYGDNSDTNDNVIYHNLDHWVLGIRGSGTYAIRTHLNHTDKYCPHNNTSWMLNGQTGWIENKFIKVRCFFTNLMDQEMFIDRLNGTFETEKKPMIRFFADDATSVGQNEDFEAFIQIFPELHAYNTKLTVHQIDCNQTHIGLYCDYVLPRIATFNVTYNEPTPFGQEPKVLSFLGQFNVNEQLDKYLDRTIGMLQPNKPPDECCQTLNLHIPGFAQFSGLYNKTAQVGPNGLVLYRKREISKSDAFFLYFFRTKVCIGPDPTLECIGESILTSNPDDHILCTQSLRQGFTVEGTFIECVYDMPGLTTPDYLTSLIEKDELNYHVVRFFNDKEVLAAIELAKGGAESRENATIDDQLIIKNHHTVWQSVVKLLDENQCFSHFIPHMIDCGRTDSQAFCAEHKINNFDHLEDAKKPTEVQLEKLQKNELVIFNSGNPMAYTFSTILMNDPYNRTDWTRDSIQNYFMKSVPDINPLKPSRFQEKKAKLDISACCDILEIEAIGGKGFGTGVYLKQDDSKFGHVHYVHKYENFEIYFDEKATDKQYNVGKPFATLETRINMRSTGPVGYYDNTESILGRTACPSEFRQWQFREVDSDLESDWDDGRKITFDCITTDELDELESLGRIAPVEVPEIEETANGTLIGDWEVLVRRAAEDKLRDKVDKNQDFHDSKKDMGFFEQMHELHNRLNTSIEIKPRIRRDTPPARCAQNIFVRSWPRGLRGLRDWKFEPWNDANTQLAPGYFGRGGGSYEKEKYTENGFVVYWNEKSTQGLFSTKGAAFYIYFCPGQSNRAGMGKCGVKKTRDANGNEHHEPFEGWVIGRKDMKSKFLAGTIANIYEQDGGYRIFMRMAMSRKEALQNPCPCSNYWDYPERWEYRTKKTELAELTGLPTWHPVEPGPDPMGKPRRAAFEWGMFNGKPHGHRTCCPDGAEALHSLLDFTFIGAKCQSREECKRCEDQPDKSHVDPNPTEAPPGDCSPTIILSSDPINYLTPGTVENGGEGGGKYVILPEKFNGRDAYMNAQYGTYFIFWCQKDDSFKKPCFTAATKGGFKQGWVVGERTKATEGLVAGKYAVPSHRLVLRLPISDSAAASQEHICPCQDKLNPDWEYRLRSTRRVGRDLSQDFTWKKVTALTDPDPQVSIIKMIWNCKDGPSISVPPEPEWGKFSDWTPCPKDPPCYKEQPVPIPVKTRTRECNMPGRCSGSATESDACPVTPCEAEWGQWQEWQGCTETCGSGFRKTRARECIVPKLLEETTPSTSAHPTRCGPETERVETQSCGLSECPPYWGEWEPWSACSQPCKDTTPRAQLPGSSTDTNSTALALQTATSSAARDGGYQFRYRQCSASDRQKCIDVSSDKKDAAEDRDCNTQPCPPQAAFAPKEGVFGDKEPYKVKKPPVFDGALTDAAFDAAMDKIAELQEKLDKRMQEFDKNFDANTKLIMQEAEKDLQWLSTPFQPMVLDMNPGAGIGVDGQLLQDPSMELMITSPASFGVEDWGEGIGASKKPAYKSTSLGDMMINDCYRSNRFTEDTGPITVDMTSVFYKQKKENRDASVSSGNIHLEFIDDRFYEKNENFLFDYNTMERQSVGDDISCPMADNILNVCNDIIDAAQYIGVTFDIRKGYNVEGYRSQIVIYWCSWAKKFANNRFDVPDFMHVQGVYETIMKTESFNTVKEYAEIKSSRSNTKAGSSAFQEETAKLSAAKSESNSDQVDASLGAPVAQLDSTTKWSDTEGESSNLNQFSRSESTKRSNSINDKKSRTTSKVETMISEMTIDIMRYEAYMDDPLPSYFTPEFLEDFQILPDSFYSPDAPEKFEMFIQRWGTHVVKSVKLGGKFTMKRTARNEGKVKIEDFQRETQAEFQRVTSSSFSEKLQEEASNDLDVQATISGGDPKGSFSATASGGVQDINQNSNSDTDAVDNTGVTSNLQQDGGSSITSDKSQVRMDQMYIDVEGGSHLVAATINDIYSPHFKRSLKEWLQSIPKFPKPFDMNFQPLPEMLGGLVGSFIDDDCTKQCFAHTSANKNKDLTEVPVNDPSLNENSGSDFCIKPRTESFNCKDPNVYKWDECYKICSSGLPTCQITKEDKKPCLALTLEKEKWKRRVDALDTAIEIYIEKGKLTNDKDVFIRAGPKGCTTDYEGRTSADDPFDGPDEQWEQEAVYPLQVQLDLTKDVFTLTDSDILRLEPKATFYLRFDGEHKLWYTMDDPDDIVISDMESAPYNSRELKTVEVVHDQVNGPTIRRNLKVPIAKEIRLKHGIFLTVDVESKALIFTPQNYLAMEASKDVDTVTFFQTYKELLEPCAASNKVFGTYITLKPKPFKTPVPCLAAWSMSQMFQTTPDLQQCVKVAVQAKSEYFFIMTERINDQHAWIYVHQQRESLCIHRLDRSGTEDELGICAEFLGEMEELDDFTEMYVCTNYLKDESKLRIMVGRPNYNSRNLESATIILSVTTMINELNHEGPPIYYALASGQAQLIVRQIYVTNLERVTCLGDYELVTNDRTTAIYQSCDLTCDSQCAGGCNKREDPTACMACNGATLYFSAARFRCIETCGDLNRVSLTSSTSIRTANVSYVYRDSDTGEEVLGSVRSFIEELPNTDAQTPNVPEVCRTCHPECAFGCTGTSNKDCISANILSNPSNKGCKNVQYGLEFGRCLLECPNQHFAEDEDVNGDIIKLCKACDPACKECIHKDVDYDGLANLGIQGYMACCGTVCNEGYLSLDRGVDKIMCLKDACPTDYFATEDKRCIAKWTVIGYQDDRWNETGFYERSLQYGTLQEPLTNYLDLRELKAGEKFERDSKWKLKFEWEMDTGVMVVLEWEQNFAPDQSAQIDTTAFTLGDPLTATSTNQVHISSFKSYDCAEDDPPGGKILKLEYLEPFADCSSNLVANSLITAANEAQVFEKFRGIVINKDYTDPSTCPDCDKRPIYPIVQSTPEELFWSFGHSFIYRGREFPAFVDESLDHVYALKTRLSVFDVRKAPGVTVWGAWTAADGVSAPCEVCGVDQPKYRERECTCKSSDCFPCIVELTDEGVCDTTACPFGEWSDWGNCAYQSSCCDTLKLAITADTSSTVDGSYSRIYVGEDPSVFYKKLGEDLYIHYDKTVNLWVISNDYWKQGDVSPNYITYFKSTIQEAGRACPSDVESWEMIDQTDLSTVPNVVVEAACEAIDLIRCPDDHPWAYNDGASCCATPFEDIDDDEGLLCDGSPIGINSKCCLNADLRTDLTVPCPNGLCLNNEAIIAEHDKERDFNFLVDTNGFHRYRHRQCTGAEISYCGDTRDLTEFYLCPNWLLWGSWSACETYGNVELTDDSDDCANSGLCDDQLSYELFRRSRVRQCNTGNQDDCLNEPGLAQDVEQLQTCVNWSAWTLWSTYKQLGDTSTEVSCFRGTRYRDRSCMIPDPTPLIAEDSRYQTTNFGTDCSGEDAQGHINFIDKDGTGKETLWETHNQFETSLISPCVWAEWSDNSLDIDGWVSDCGLHNKDVGTQQRIRSCVSDDTGGVDGQPMCNVNREELETTPDSSRQCVGPTELIFEEGVLYKFCEKIIETESVYCPLWSEWSDCSATCTWLANRDAILYYDSKITSETKARVDKYYHPARTREIEAPNSNVGVSPVRAATEEDPFNTIAYTTRKCVIGPVGMQTDLDKKLWYLCNNKQASGPSNAQVWQIPMPLPTYVAQTVATGGLDQMLPELAIVAFQDDNDPTGATRYDQNLGWKMRCNYRPCPSWTEWRTGYEEKTKGHGQNGPGKGIIAGEIAMVDSTGFAGCPKLDKPQTEVSKWQRKCMQFGELDFEQLTTFSTILFGEPNSDAGDCVGDSVELRSDCPMWSAWAVDIDRCASSDSTTRFEHRTPYCNKNDMFAEFRVCNIGGIDGNKNPRCVTELSSQRESLGAFTCDETFNRKEDCRGNKDFDCRPNALCDATLRYNQYDVDQKKTKMQCGVPASNAFECYWADKYDDKEEARWILIIAAIAAAVAIHALIPLFG